MKFRNRKGYRRLIYTNYGVIVCVNTEYTVDVFISGNNFYSKGGFIMADRITQAEPDRFAVDILKDRRVRSSFETTEYYTMKDACVRNSQSRPYNSYPLLFKGFIYKKENGRYCRMLRTPIHSQYIIIEMADEEVNERIGKELVLTSMEALKKAYQYADEYLDNPGWLINRKDLQEYFNKIEKDKGNNEHTR